MQTLKKYDANNYNKHDFNLILTKHLSSHLIYIYVCIGPIKVC